MHRIGQRLSVFASGVEISPHSPTVKTTGGSEPGPGWNMSSVFPATELPLPAKGKLLSIFPRPGMVETRLEGNCRLLGMRQIIYQVPQRLLGVA